jgi:hypothetical protein
VDSRRDGDRWTGPGKSPGGSLSEKIGAALGKVAGAQLGVLEAALGAFVGKLVVQTVRKNVASVAAGKLAKDEGLLLCVADGNVGVKDAVHVCDIVVEVSPGSEKHVLR